MSVRKQQNELLKLAGELNEEGISFELQFLGEAGGSTRCASFAIRAKLLGGI